ncbi:MAG TPA: hypothetical protein VF625_05405 [Longimicrobium sp.]
MSLTIVQGRPPWAALPFIYRASGMLRLTLDLEVAASEVFKAFFPHVAPKPFPSMQIRERGSTFWTESSQVLDGLSNR